MNIQRHIHPDKTSRVADAAGTVTGAAAGALAAPALASGTGATAIPVITATAKWIGLTVLSATPAAWIAGAAIAGGLAGLAATRLLKGIGGDKREARLDDERRQR